MDMPGMAATTASSMAGMVMPTTTDAMAGAATTAAMAMEDMEGMGNGCKISVSSHTSSRLSEIDNNLTNLRCFGIGTPSTHVASPHYITTNDNC